MRKLAAVVLLSLPLVSGAAGARESIHVDVDASGAPGTEGGSRTQASTDHLQDAPAAAEETPPETPPGPPESDDTPGGRQGPRVGLVYVPEGAADTLNAGDRGKGLTLVTAWGWQFEHRVASYEDGRVRFVGFVPYVTGLEEGLYAPSVDVLFGVRTAADTEFAAGANLCPGGVGLAVALGKTLRAGEMSFPVGLGAVYNAEGVRFSMTLGWNLRR